MRRPARIAPSRSTLAFAVAAILLAPPALAQDTATTLDAVQVTAQRPVYGQGVINQRFDHGGQDQPEDIAAGCILLVG